MASAPTPPPPHYYGTSERRTSPAHQTFLQISAIFTKLSAIAGVQPRSAALLGSPTRSRVLAAHARRVGVHHRHDSCVLRLRDAPAVRDREASRALRSAVALFAARSCRERRTRLSAVPRALDALPATPAHRASLARTRCWNARAVRPRPLRRRACVRRQRRRLGNARLPLVGRDRRVGYRERRRFGAPARPARTPARDAPRARPDERRRRVASDDRRVRRGGRRSGARVPGRAVGAGRRERARSRARNLPKFRGRPSAPPTLAKDSP